ncbi:NAD(P)/FAD-dependent oxidoreductase [Virgisporangium aurantiacum]|uniref:Amine oxidase n=1 Tax=Virgisporangium aurantiacum TaxID=175570 RepID=A0A8J3Z938_9ACTN|nr:FAD-dependent oxidoreductase [Virgisporangium aurantiacum]GIJ57128.1 amine oxidase [Virgisporangium aurantiacum]
MTAGRRRVAVIGAGVSGLTAAYLLQRTADVTLYEADDRLGGHAHTHDLTVAGRRLAVDSGFIVCNEYTYPTLLRLFAELGVSTQPARMSMSVRCEGCGLTYAGANGPRGVFAQPTNAVRARFLAMIGQVPVFHRRARALLAHGNGVVAGDGGEPTLGEFLSAGRYTTYFVRHFVVPLVSAVWSCGPQLVAEYPARYLFTFLAHHGMLGLGRTFGWQTVPGGSRRYVDAVTARLSAVRTANPVRALRRDADGVELRDGSDTVVRFDAAVVATHADQALALLAESSPQQRAVLGAFAYSRNEAVLHCDGSVLPDLPTAQASWNYVLPGCAPSPGRVQVSYDMNRLQRLGSEVPLVVTVNGDGRIRPDHVLARMVYEHPIYTLAGLAAQRRLPAISDATVAFAGAYHGWGFHEDGCVSGVMAARRLGAVW